jgi:hypothetical protein
MMKHALVIPTNRDASRAVVSAAAELRYARSVGYDIPLVVIETDDGRHVAENARALRNCEVRDGHKVFHFTMERQRKLLELACVGDLEQWCDIFLSGIKDYGTAMNKCFLYPLALGASSVHRRDSDTVTLDCEYPNEINRLPLAHELSLLGTSVASEAGGVTGGDVPVTVVGGNYVGEWNLDVKDLVTASGGRTVLSSLYQTLGFDRDSIPAMVAEAFPEQIVIPERDVLTVVRSVKDGLNPDCGNVAFMDVQSVLPTLPGPNILAADYFAFDAATSLGLPSIHHSDAVFHVYTSDRFKVDAKISYWEGVARFADYFNVYGEIYDGTLSERLGIPPATLPTSCESRLNLASLVRSVAGRDRSERVKRLRSLGEDLLVPLGGDLAIVGVHLASNAERFVDECNYSYGTHARLIEDWPSLVDRFSTIDAEELLF